MFVNLGMEMEARNITQHYICDIANTTHGKLQEAFGYHAISRPQAFCWHKIFSGGRTLVEVEQFGRLPSAKWTGDSAAQVRELVRSYQRVTVKMIADEVNMNWNTVHMILTEEMGMRSISAKIVPRNLTFQQREALLSAVCVIPMHYGDASASLFTRFRT
jgi:hypothetical protein